MSEGSALDVIPGERFQIFDRLSDSLVIGVLPSYTEIAVLDLSSGTETPWDYDWSPESDGWYQGGIWDLDVSPDRSWVLVARVFFVYSGEVDYFIPGYEAVGLVLSRTDGSMARCIALGLCPAGGSMPQYAFSSDSRLIMGNDISTRYMAPEEFGSITGSQDFFQGYRDSLRYFDMADMELVSIPFDSDSGRNIFPGLNTGFMKSPWDDTTLFYVIPGGSPPVQYQFRPLLPEGPALVVDIQLGEPCDLWPVSWVTPDLFLFRKSGAYVLAGTDGSLQQLPDSVSSWHFSDFMQDGTCVFRRGDGAPEESGRIFWDDFLIESAGSKED
jgi:hypothetical protein